MRPVNIIKVVHADKVGFDLHQITYLTEISVHAAVAEDPPFVMVKGVGDFRPLTIPITGDVTIMNADGVVLVQETYERLILKARSEQAATEVCKTLRENMGLADRPIDWDAVKISLERHLTRYPPGGAIQGSEPQQFYNAAEKDAHFDKGYSYDLFAELFGSSLPIIEMALATYHRHHPNTKYKIYHRKTPTESGVIGYLEANKQMIFAIFQDEAKTLIDLSHSYLSSYGLVKSGSGRIMLMSGEGITAFTTPRCDNGFTPLKNDLSPVDYAGR